MHAHAPPHTPQHTHTHTSTCTSDHCDCAVKLYSEPNFQGRSIDVIHTQNARLANEGFAAQAASAQLVGTCSWLFYDSENFQGNAYLLYPGDYYSNLAWGAQGKSLSSLRSLPPEGTVAIALFDEFNFKGRMVVVHASVNNLQTVYNFNDKTNSVVVVNGTWKLCENSNYQGASIKVPPRYHYPNGIGTLTYNRVSSIEYLRSG